MFNISAHFVEFMTIRKEEFKYNGYKAAVLFPDNFNGKWVWKMEFFYAFDQAEQELFTKGYARVYYEISDMYGAIVRCG